MPLPGSSPLRDLVSLALVAGAAAAALRGLDRLPDLLGEPAAGRPFTSVVAVERRVGARLLLPAYFPDTLQWPAARIRVIGHRPALVVLAFAARSEGPRAGAERLWLAQSIGGRRWPDEAQWP